jgi:Ca2+-binding EF-hand superfamily protein
MSEQRLRQQRNVFLLFLGACFVALMAALPIVTAQSQKQMQARTQPDQTQTASRSAAAGGTVADNPDFARVDRNKDGFVDKGEAGVVPGLSANFERADRNQDGKLDAAEFQKGLEILSVRR